MTQPLKSPPFSPVVLEGRWVRLEPLTMDHLPDLLRVGLDEALWQWTVDLNTSEAALTSYLRRALDDQKAGTALPFATIDRASGRAIGSTRFGNYDRDHARIEIGWTWIGREWQRTATNTEAKLLMLTHAFDTLGLRRVELKTDALNDQSRNAIKRLGAVEEGIFRQHMMTYTGRLRDTVYYSILAHEWPAVRARLQARLT